MRSSFMKGAAFASIFILAGVGLHFAAASFMPDKSRTDTDNLGSISVAVPDSGEVSAIREIPDANKDSILRDLDVQSAFVMDLSSGNEIISIESSKRWPLASLSKVMSSVVALENIDSEKEITISVSAVETEGTAGNLVAGNIFTAHDLVTAMMVVSSNDAAVALSENMESGRFVELMNAKAKELGMNNTHFAEPTGLSSLNQSTLSDMSRLMSYVWKSHQELFVTSSKTKAYIKELSSKKRKELVNINALSSRSNFLGGKTGYTDDARQNLVSVFSFDKRPIGIMILGAEDRVVEADKIINFLKNGYGSN